MRKQTTPTANGETRLGHTPHRRTICVVDGRPGDYAGWQESAQTGGVEVRFFERAADALRFARTTAIDLWVVNQDLPGLSGLELCDMLKAQSSRTVVYLVADEYSATAEQAAWQHRATLFGAKPAHEAWLAAWLGQCSAHRPTDRPAARLPSLNPTL